MTAIMQFLAEGLSVLYIGHSLVSPTLPEMMQDLLDAPVEYQILNGAPLELQWKDSASAQGVTARDWLPAHPVDALVLTERVPLATTIEWHHSADWAERWLELAAGANPRVQGYLYETWDDLDDARTGSTQAWRDRILADLPLWQGIVDQVNAARPPGTPPMRLIPAGLGMVRLDEAVRRGEVPGADSIRDFLRDDIHPNDAGFYYVAMIHYAALTGRSPVGLPARLMGRDGPYPALPADQARALQGLAARSVAGFASGDGG